MFVKFYVLADFLSPIWNLLHNFSSLEKDHPFDIVILEKFEIAISKFQQNQPISSKNSKWVLKKAQFFSLKHGFLDLMVLNRAQTEKKQMEMQ